jgi:hypothetical protein
MHCRHPASPVPLPHARRLQGLLPLLLSGLLLVSQSGCLGTAIESPARSSRSHSRLQIHLLAAPTLIRADVCKNGLADITTYVPLWGLAVGILTLGIVVPARTVYSCVATSPSPPTATP